MKNSVNQVRLSIYNVDNAISGVDIKEEVTYQITKVNEDTVRITLYWGEKPTSGYQIRIGDIVVEGNQLKVDYLVTYPNPDLCYSHIITYPTHSCEVKVGSNVESFNVILIRNDKLMQKT